MTSRQRHYIMHTRIVGKSTNKSRKTGPFLTSAPFFLNNLPWWVDKLFVLLGLDLSKIGSVLWGEWSANCFFWATHCDRKFMGILMKTGAAFTHKATVQFGWPGKCRKVCYDLLVQIQMFYILSLCCVNHYVLICFGIFYLLYSP